MAMWKLDTINKPRGRIVKENDPSAKCVRVYANSPEDLILQLWSGNRYMMVALMPTEARAIAEQLIATADALTMEGEDK